LHVPLSFTALTVPLCVTNLWLVGWCMWHTHATLSLFSTQVTPSPYTSQLLALHSWHNSTAGHPTIPSECSQIVMPINPHFWEQGLANHPDKKFTSFIIRGLYQGFQIGFTPTLTCLQPAQSNLCSVTQHPNVIWQYLEQEVSKGQTLTAQNHPVLGTTDQPTGCCPKKGKLSKWRMIIDLSLPLGHSVNYGITKKSCSFHYTSINEAAMASGAGTLMANMNIQQAYHNIPVAWGVRNSSNHVDQPKNRWESLRISICNRMGCCSIWN